MDTIAEKLAASAKDFERLVWPVLQPILGGDRITRVEGLPHEFCKDLDRAGIDAWYVSGEHMYGVASRVQWVGPRQKLYQSFTLKWLDRHGRRAEFWKHLAAIQDSSLHPHRTVQAFVATPAGFGSLIVAACVRTLDLVRFVENGTEGKDYVLKLNRKDGSTFAAVEWASLRAVDIPMATIPGPAYTRWTQREDHEPQAAASDPA